MNCIKDQFGRCAYHTCRADLPFGQAHKPACPHAAPVEPRPTVLTLSAIRLRVSS